jgi:hypothetical protein
LSVVVVGCLMPRIQIVLSVQIPRRLHATAVGGTNVSSLKA